ncbi:MAG TPA: zf-HC2 domain-containing protein [Gemmatimonadaceae bacterium]|nr:zf-HC2 domain-containing protein [Gemmatimonadaceae bacterium]
MLLHVWDALDDQLTPAAADMLHEHVAACDKCRKYQRFQAKFLQALATLRSRQCAPRQVRLRVLDSLVTAGYSPP